jgi:ABC-type anion transport system duplicated permease subunit
MGDKNISLLVMLTDLANKEADLLWTRYSAMLYASTGLVGILSFALEQQLKSIAVGCAILGLIFALVWIQLIRLSSYYYQRWQMDADYLVSKDEKLSEIVRGRINPRLKQPVKGTASKYAMVLPISFAIAWIILGAGILGFIPLF